MEKKRHWLSTGMQCAVCALFAAGILLAFGSCGENAAQTDAPTQPVSADTAETETASTAAETELTDNLPERDYKGADFNILLRALTSYEMVAEELNGEIMNDAVYNRNQKISERFNVKLNTITKAGWADANSEMIASLRQSILAGEDSYDLALGYQAFIVEMAMAGMFNNFYEVPGIDLTKPWWSQKCVEILTLDNCLYMLSGDISHTLWRGLYVLFFNKQVAENYGVNDLYQTVSDGKWYFDDFVTLCKSISADLNGDGAYTVDDMYGLLTCLANHIRQYMVSLDTPLTTLGDDGYPVLTFNNEKSIDVLERVNDLYWANSTLRSPELQEPTANTISGAFTSDHVLFVSAFLGNAELLRNMDTDFGILPYPKYDEYQEEYYTATHNSVSTVIIPITVSDLERAGFLTEALCFEGYTEIVPKYYDVVLKNKFARDEESAVMLDIIRDGISFNFGWVHSIPMNSIGAFYSDLVAKNDTDFASYYAKNEATYVSALNDIVAKYKEARK